MAKIKPRAADIPEPETIYEAESSALERELRLWADLLLDIYVDKRRNRGKTGTSEKFDLADTGQ